MCPQNDFLFWVDLYFHCFLFIYLLHSWAQVLRKKYSFYWKPKKWRVSIFHLTFPIPQPCPWISLECARKRPPPTLAAWCPDAFVNPLEPLSAPAVSKIHAFSRPPRTFFPTLHSHIPTLIISLFLILGSFSLACLGGFDCPFCVALPASTSACYNAVCSLSIALSTWSNFLRAATSS